MAESTWPLRLRSFFLSVLSHSLVTALLAYLPGSHPFFSAAKPLQREEPVIIIPKATIYWVPLKQSVERIAPSEGIRVAEVASGRVRRKEESVVVEQPNPVNRKQMVWQPESPERVDTQKELPDMVAVRQQKQAPKRFTPPPAATPSPAPAQPVLDQPDVLSAQPAPAVREFAISLPTAKPKPKAFVPPKEQPRPAGTPGVIADAPSLNAPNGSSATMTSVVVGLNPAAINTPPPKGSEAASFSTGPRRGAPATVPATGLSVPGVAVQGRETAKGGTSPGPASTPAPNAAPPQWFESVPPRSASSLSAPLRPGARTVPRAIEARFSNRTLYTSVVPKPNLPEYSGDWTIWFSERNPVPAGVSQVRAPFPLRKLLTRPAQPGLPSPAAAAEGFVQIAAVVGVDGRLTAIQPLPGRFPQIAEKAAADVAAWQFRPASVNGTPVEADVVIEIFFRTF